MKFLAQGLAIAILTALSGCGAANRVADSADKAVAQLERGVNSFEEAVSVLEAFKTDLDNEKYKNQADELIRTTGQVAQLSVEGSLDFTRTRLIEDLTNIKRHALGQSPAARVPVLSNTQSSRIDFASGGRSTITIVGWNLDVAAKDKKKFKVVVKNAQTGDREVDHSHVTYHGQYAVTIDISTSGIPLQHHDSQLVFAGYEPGRAGCAGRLGG